VPERRRNRVKEPRNGALVVALVVVFITLAVVAAYFLLAPSRTTDVPEVRKPETPVASSTVQPLPRTPSAVVPPVAEQNDMRDQHAYSKAVDTPRDKKSSSKRKSGKGRLAIIIDDMGNSMPEARSLAAIGVTLNFSVIPGLRDYREVALFAESKGIETMIHIPMQSKGWPERRMENNGLLVSMGDAELRERVAGFLRDIPGAVGANNHMGSEFTEHEDKMRSVLETLKSNDLFFVDSVTSMQTTGLRLAAKLRMRSGRRHVFLDNEQERGYILRQLDQAVRLAKKTGSAIAICHPHPATIATLAAALPGLAEQGITLVPVSQIVR